MSSFQSTKRVIDAALEIPIVPGSTNLGYRIRRNLWAWSDPAQGSMDGTWALVTGGTTGIGRAGALGLARAGAGVVITGRDAKRAEAAARELSDETGSEVIGLGADLSHLDQAAVLAKEVIARLDHVDVVVHNAGAMFGEYEAHDGIERTQVLHVLSPFLLTRRLSPLIPNSTRSRIVFMSSGGMYSQRLEVAKLQAGPSGYRGPIAYARAKRAQVALAHRFSERLPGRGVHAMQPGWVDTPGLHESLPRFERALRPLLRRPEEGADTLIWLCTAAAAGTTTGLFWLDRRPRREAMLVGSGSIEEEKALWDWCEGVTSAY
ncbi:MAG: SDR family NAD(P)-dependent oxidoreductase [Acidimicrobiales bacterium]